MGKLHGHLHYSLIEFLIIKDSTVEESTKSLPGTMVLPKKSSILLSTMTSNTAWVKLFLERVKQEMNK